MVIKLKGLLSKTLVLFCFACPCSAESKYKPGVTRLLDDSHYQLSTSPDFLPIAVYYARQGTENTCSLATLSTTLNALEWRKYTSWEYPYISEKKLLAQFPNEHWAKELLKENGLSLGEMGTTLAFICEKYNIDASIQVTPVNEANRETRQAFHNALVQNEKSDNDFIIIDYPEGYFLTDDHPEESGHFSVIAGYCSHKKRVLIFDVYTNAEPYWVDEDALFSSLHTRDDCSPEKTFRGYIVVKRKSAP